MGAGRFLNGTPQTNRKVTQRKHLMMAEKRGWRRKSIQKWTTCKKAAKNKKKTNFSKTHRRNSENAKDFEKKTKGRLYRKNQQGEVGEKCTVFVSQFNGWPSMIKRSNTGVKKDPKFFRNHLILSGVPKTKTISTDMILLLKAQTLKNFAKILMKIDPETTINTYCNRLVETWITTMKRLVLVKLEDGLNLVENVNSALWVMRFPAHTSRKLTLSEMH